MYYDSSTISGDACTVIQDATYVALRLPTFYLRCRYDLTASRSRRQLKVSLQLYEDNFVNVAFLSLLSNALYSFIANNKRCLFYKLNIKQHFLAHSTFTNEKYYY